MYRRTNRDRSIVGGEGGGGRGGGGGGGGLNYSCFLRPESRKARYKEVSDRVSGRVLRFDVTGGQKGARDDRILAFWNVWAGETGFQHRVRPSLWEWSLETKRKSGQPRQRHVSQLVHSFLYNISRTSRICRRRFETHEFSFRLIWSVSSVWKCLSNVRSILNIINIFKRDRIQ